MGSYAAKRLVLALLVAITVSLISFVLLRFSGDLAHAIAGPSATARDVEAVRHAYGLDRPVAVQYVDWARRAVHGDLGESFFLKEPVSGLIAKRLPVTLALGVCALLFAVALSIPLGILAALRPRSWIDRLALTLGVLGQALPSFWFALLLIIVFGLQLHWFPISGAESWRSFVLPSIALGYYGAPALLRLTRNGMLEVLGSDYIRTARAKGLRMPAVIFRHALRNAIIPVVAVAAVQSGFMLGGSIVIESVFSLHGVGYLAWEAISRADFPVVQAIVLVLASIYIVLTLVADLVNALLDPRIRVQP